MLLMLSQWLQGLSPEFGFFRVFQYLTFRAVMAASAPPSGETASRCTSCASPSIRCARTEVTVPRTSAPRTSAISVALPTDIATSTEVRLCRTASSCTRRT